MAVNGRIGRKAVLSVLAAAAALVVPSGTAVAEVASGHGKSSEPSALASVAVIGTRAAVPVSGQVAAREARGSGYACVIQVRRKKRVTAYQVLQLYAAGHSHEIHWIVEAYSVSHARLINKTSWTFQIQLCEAGSGHTWNHYHQWFDGAAQVVNFRRPHMLGWKWGDKVVGGTASAALDFQVNVGVVTIGASTSVASADTHGGSTGPDPDLGWPRTWRKYNANRINAFYVAPHNFIWDGTGSEEGNVGHSLYEFVSGRAVRFDFSAVATIRGFCARPHPLTCPKF
jgi:hypothetical protein